MCTLFLTRDTSAVESPILLAQQNVGVVHRTSPLCGQNSWNGTSVRRLMGLRTSHLRDSRCGICDRQCTARDRGGNGEFRPRQIQLRGSIKGQRAPCLELLDVPVGFRQPPRGWLCRFPTLYPCPASWA